MFHRRKEVLSLKIDKDKCIACESCVFVCRQKVLDMRYEMSACYAWVKYENDCKGCGKCVRVCNSGAIKLITN